MRCDGWPAKNKYIFSFTGGLSAYRAHKAARVVSVCIIMCCGAVFAQNQPARTVCCCTHFWHSARAQNTYKCRMETHTQWNTTRHARVLSVTAFIYFAILLFSPGDSASSGRKICILCDPTALWPPFPTDTFGELVF